MRSFDGRARYHHGRCSAMVSDWQMCVVWLQGVRGPAKHAADVMCVVAAGVEVGIVPNVHGQVHRHLR